ncbi:MAG: helix-turn-helix domain-containing protein [Clostridium sp.]
MNNFGDRFKEQRQKKGLTQQELADIFHINRSSISRYEKNQQVPEVQLLQKICDFFEVSIDYLVNGDTNENNSSQIKNTLFGKRLIQLRTEKNLTQQQVASKIHSSKANISRYESNSIEPNLKTLNELAELFDVSVDFLLGRTTVRKQPDTLAFHSAPGYEKLNDEDRQYIDDLITRLSKKND